MPPEEMLIQSRSCSAAMAYRPFPRDRKRPPAPPRQTTFQPSRADSQSGPREDLTPLILGLGPRPRKRPAGTRTRMAWHVPLSQIPFRACLWHRVATVDSSWLGTRWLPEQNGASSRTPHEILDNHKKNKAA
jgi:hypothetical protein